MKPSIFRTAGAALASVILTVAPGGSAEMIPFVLPWDDGSPGPADLRPIFRQNEASIRPVSVRDGHLFAGDQRLRIFGVNVTAGACFPDRETAGRVAARMAKFGFNAVRFHFLDATWGRPQLIDYASGDWQNWNAEALDRMDYFAARLREQGIYLNLNLLVGRKFGAKDGIDSAISKLEWKDSHAVGFFHAPHFAAQKAYARRLLTRRNPHTGLTYAGDPAVAMVEINNENGLLHTWLSGAFDELPELFAGDLRGQWNAWLAARHGTTEALAAAWKARHEPPGPELLANGDFSQGAARWNLERHAAADASQNARDGTMVIAVRRGGAEPWHVQLNQSGIRLRSDALYTLRFRAAADRPREISLNLMQAHEPWQSLAGEIRVTLEPGWQDFEFTFLTHTGGDNARIGFSGLSADGAEFRFAAVSLRPGGRTGLDAAESISGKSVRVPRRNGAAPLSAEARRDWITFLRETEDRYWREMRRFLREDLGVRAPVAGTIVATSTPHLMAAMDIVDTHAYWQHPVFPRRQWDLNDWTVRNVPMTDHPDEATLSRLALQRVMGKPHMVSEYNHPAPNLHAAEGPLLLAAFAALQDWDALFLYTYSHGDAATKAGKIPGFFDIGQHPPVMAGVPVASLMFRRGDVSVARETVAFPLAVERETELIAAHGQAWNVVPLNRPDFDPAAAFVHRTALDLSGKQRDAGPPSSERPPGQSTRTADTGELVWRLLDGNKGTVEVRSPRTKLVTGRIDGRRIDLGDGVTVTAGKTAAGWCAVALTSLDGGSFAGGVRRALLVAAGQAENSRMVWKNEEKTSVAGDWGEAPSLVEQVPAVVGLPVFPDTGPAVVYPLDETGQRRAPIPVRETGSGAMTVEPGPPHATLWYEIVWPAKR